MTVQTTFVRPEDDPANWFTGKEVRGPAIVTAVTCGSWGLFDREPSDRVQAIAWFDQLTALHKFFVPAGHVLRIVDRSSQGLISGYRLPPL